MDKNLFIRHVNIAACNVLPEDQKKGSADVQPDLFSDIKETEKLNEELLKKSEKEKRQMLAAISIKKRFGKNAIVRLMDLEEGAKTIDRNNQIGGHKA
ncbi:MAG: hypothetical protein J6P81_05980 [Spirochaetales bacterium]|nr:hypothetical protein [Spirochaetales bacterium]